MRDSQRDVELHSKAGSSLASLLAAFCRCSSLGVAILDDQLRFLATNKALAAMNGIAVEAHVSRSVVEVIGELSKIVEPKMQRVLATGQHISTCLAGTLPCRAEPGQWIEKYFPIRDAQGRVKRIGAIIVEVTAHTELQERVQTLGVKGQRTLARELRDSIRQYQFALDLSLENLLRHTSRLEQRGKYFEQAIVELDQRVAAMQEFVASVSPQI